MVRSNCRLGLAVKTRRKPIRKLAIGAFIFLIVQMVFGLIVDDCYPGWILPGFGGSAASSQFVSRTHLELMAVQPDGTDQQPTDAELLGGMPPTRRRAILHNLFPKDVPSGSTAHEAGGPATVWRTLRDASLATRPVAAERSPDIRRWLRSNLAEALGNPPARLIARWEKRRIRRGTWELHDTETLRTIELDFHTNSTDSEGKHNE